MADSPSKRIRVRCTCGTSMKLPAAARGKRAKCPKCEKVFAVPQSAPEATPTTSTPAATPPQDDHGDSLLEELARMEKTAEAVSTPGSVGPSQKCPECGTIIPAGSVLCMSCGYNRETGRTVKAASARKAAIGGAVRRLASGAGNFALGCVLSGVGALLGAVVWCVIVVVTQYEIGWIACGVGALAGAGMALGYRKKNARAGFVAAGISVFGIVAAKVMFFAFVIHAVVTGNTSNIDFQREYVKAGIIEEILDEREVYGEAQRYEQWDTAYDEADRRVEGMSDARVREWWEESRANEALNQEGKPERLTLHRAERRADQAGLSFTDEWRDEFYEEEQETVQAMSSDAVDAAVAKLDAWENGGKWSDAEYVEAHLVYQHVIQEIERRGAEIADPSDAYWEPNAEEWNELYARAAADVAAIPASERAGRSKEMETEGQERLEQQSAELAGEQVDEAAGELIGAFFEAFFGPMDLLFFVLAMVAAYKIANGSGGD